MSESLYVAENSTRLITRQNGTSASSFSIPIDRPQSAYLYFASKTELNDAVLKDLAGSTYLNADHYQIVATADLSKLDTFIPGAIPVLSGTFKLNITQKAKAQITQSDTQHLYVAEETARKISRQRAVPASSYSLTVDPISSSQKYPYIALVILNAVRPAEGAEGTFFNRTYLQQKLDAWATAYSAKAIDTAAILGKFDSTDIGDFEKISALYDFVLTGTNKLTFKTNN